MTHRLRLPSVDLALAVLVPFVVGLSLHSQGVNLLDDGLWLLGAKLLREGDALYRDLFSIYGPARYLALLPFTLLFGVSLLAVAVVKALGDALVAGLGYRLARDLGAGRASWLVPLGVLALGPFEPRFAGAALFAGWLVRLGGNPPGARGALGLGAAWGALACFGLDAAGYGGVILATTLLLSTQRAAWLRRLPTLLLGTAVILLGAAGILALRGALGDAIWGTLVYPLTRFRQEMGQPWYGFLGDGARLGEAFASLRSGEALEAVWPLQSAARTLALRLLYLGAWIVPLLSVLLAFRGRLPRRVGPLIGLAVAGWAVLLGRGDPLHLRTAWLGSLWLLPLLAAVPRRGWPRAALASAMAILMLAPLAGESLWLASRIDRPQLRRWHHEAAGVWTSASRIQRLEEIEGLLPRDDAPVLFWPTQPGFHVLFDRPLATRQITLLPGETRDPARVIAELEGTRARHAILGLRWRVQGRVLRDTEPELWDYLRARYRLLPDELPGNKEFALLGWVDGELGAARALPITEQLHDREQLLGNAIGPPMTPGRSMGQSFRVGAAGLGGFAVRWHTRGRDIPARAILEIHEERGGGIGPLIRSYRLGLNISGDQHFSQISFGPLPELAGRRVVVTLQLEETPAQPLHLFWNDHRKEGRAVDHLPGGQAFLDGRPLPGDLYFLSY